MFGISDYPAFVAALLLFMLVPGPGNLAIVSGTARGGFGGGMRATLGIIAGDQVLLWCALLGVAAVLKAHPLAFAAMQWAGAAYLAWLGLRLLFARRKPQAAEPQHAPATDFLREGFLITLLNPKSIVFYMAFLPLFLNPAQRPGWATFLAIAATVAGLGIIYGAVAVWLFQRLATQVREGSRLGALFRRLTGLAFVGFGVRLAMG